MAQHVQLKAETRTKLGKKVRALRAAGVMPATVYGHNVTPVSIQLNSHEFHLALKQSGRTQLIDLTIDGQQARPVFVKQTTVDAKRNAILHVEFFQANLREKIHASVPIHFVGESQAVKDGGIFLPIHDHVDVESLPDDIPESLEADLGRLAEINGTLHVSDLQVPANVTTLLPADELIAKVDPPVVEEPAAESEEPASGTEGDAAEAESAPDS